jgi:predicted nucleic acid-binding protein
MRRLVMTQIPCFAVLACGGSGPELAPPRPTGPPAAVVASAAGPDDVVVAQVAGRPVWGSCVAAQARRGATRDRALHECIDFELLAQAAEARGFATHPEVIDETRRVLVSRLVETDFERRHRTPADMTEQIDQEIQANLAALSRPEVRASAYLRVLVPAKAPADIDQRARSLADKIHAALANETGLFVNHLEDTANRIAAGSGLTIEVQSYKFAMRGQTVPPYDAALFAIPEVGRVSPVTRTEWGWDVILLTDRLEAKQRTREEVLPLVFADLRLREFERWVQGFMKTSRIARNDQLLEVEATP